MAVLRMFAFLAFSSQVFVVHSAQWTEASFDAGRFNVSWKYDKAADVLMFQVNVQTTGWVGLGFSSTNESMKALDVVVGGKTNDGTNYLHDMHSESLGEPPKDSVQNYKLDKSEESNGKTTLWFQRKRNTADSNDHQFAVGTPVYLAYAYNKNDALDLSSFSQHDERGYSTEKYDLLSQVGLTTSAPDSNTTATATPTGATGDQTTIPTTSGEGNAVASFICVALSILFLTIIVF